MSIFRRLRLDEVTTSMPELGPTIPDGGHSWIVLFGIMIVQMTVPSVLSMYGIVLGHLASNNRRLDFDVWNEKITVTPILMTAFWSLADPWTKALVNLASVPRLMALIGVALLSIGVLASGYLATGGVGAYLASLSAGAIMGIGASFVMMQSEQILQKHFRLKLPLATTLMNFAFSTGLVLSPLVALALFTRLGIQAGLMAMIVLFLPTAIAIGFLKTPSSDKQTSSPYTLLFNEEETDSSLIRMMEESRNQTDNPLPDVDKNTESSQGVFAEGSTAFSYEDSEDINIFVFPPNHQVRSKWKQDLQVLKHMKFWAAVIACVGARAGMMLFWMLLPPLVIIKVPSTDLLDGVTLSMIGGTGTLCASVISYYLNPSSARSLIFGLSNWICTFVLLGLSYGEFYILFIVLALFGGTSIGGMVISQEFAIRDASKARAILNTCVGIAILLLCFIENMFLCLRIVGVIQLAGGIYWILSPLYGVIKR